MSDAGYRVNVEIVNVQYVVPPIFVTRPLEALLGRSPRARRHVQRQDHRKTHENTQGWSQPKIPMQIHRQNLKVMITKTEFLQ